MQDGLANPPDRVGNELEAARLVEALGRLDQAVVALVDQVGQAQTLSLVLLGDGDDEAQVGTGELVQRFFVALLDAPCQFDLLLGRQ